ncbi:SgcJ/EcaC family oxidoreductase [Pseudomonas sp. FSL R10-0399]|uniref:SgcJ/EcaC family oxidoreductase n=1 Tax=Pseudomonas sp. FSL R10-0399 TaxID=2662194 RepID=UPI0012976A4F|nr:SgcJ/EcaC family oxidoreductase [Pseudomonas sp. FSL R10-0399]MQT59216.1 SgcJ/EcaC family oxidoreductase [Pseudomonas sp. FSL R10-0399]
MKLKSAAITMIFTLGAPFVQADDTAPYIYRDIAQAPENVKDQEIADLFDRWNRALQTGNANAVIDLYAPNAVLQPTVSNKVRNTPAQIKDYFDHFLQLKPLGQINYREIRQLGSNVSMDSGVYTFTLNEGGGKTRQVQARYTFVYERVGSQWKIINHHSSAMPEVQTNTRKVDPRVLMLAP